MHQMRCCLELTSIYKLILMANKDQFINPSSLKLLFYKSKKHIVDEIAVKKTNREGDRPIELKNKMK